MSSEQTILDRVQSLTPADRQRVLDLIELLASGQSAHLDRQLEIT